MLANSLVTEDKGLKPYLAEAFQLGQCIGDPFAAHHDRHLAPIDEHGVNLKILKLTPANEIDPLNGAKHPHPATRQPVSNYTSV